MWFLISRVASETIPSDSPEPHARRQRANHLRGASHEQSHATGQRGGADRNPLRSHRADGLALLQSWSRISFGLRWAFLPRRRPAASSLLGLFWPVLWPAPSASESALLDLLRLVQRSAAAAAPLRRLLYPLSAAVSQ